MTLHNRGTRSWIASFHDIVENRSLLYGWAGTRAVLGAEC